MAKAPDEPITFVAAVANTPSAIRVEGEPDAGGRLLLEIPGSDIAQLLRLTTLRGKVLRITAEVLDGA